MSIRQSWTSWRSLSLLAAVAAALVALTMAVVPVGAASHTVALSATLSGANHSPPVETSAGGSFSGTLDMNTYEISYSLTSDAMAISQAHIHIGPADGNGPVAAFLFGPADPAEDGINVSGTVTEAVGDFDLEALGAAILGGNAYVNVHTAANPGGEVRGQIAISVTALPATGSGGLADAGGGLLPIAAGALAGLLVLTLGARARVAVRRRS